MAIFKPHPFRADRLPLQVYRPSRFYTGCTHSLTLRLNCDGKATSRNVQKQSSTIAPFGSHLAAIWPTIQYGGYCKCCCRHHYLGPTPAALAAADKLMRQLDTHSRIDFDDPSPDPLLHIDYVWNKGPGRMFGVLVCRGLGDNSEEVVLKAFSGQMSNRWNVPGWVGPIASVINSSPLYQDYRSLTETYSARLSSIEGALQLHRSCHQRQPQTPNAQRSCQGPSRPQRTSSPTGKSNINGVTAAALAAAPAAPATQAFLEGQRQLLRARRRALSHELLHTVQSSYNPCNFRGERLPLLQVYTLVQQRHVASRTDGDAGVNVVDVPAGQRATMTSAAAGKECGQDGLIETQQQRSVCDVRIGAMKVSSAAFPAGTGDCCAPKLLAAAAQLGLEPLGLVEFWYGSPPNTGTAQGRKHVPSGVGEVAGGLASTRAHKQLYGMCEKCEFILGSLLCGAQAAVNSQVALHTSM